MGDGRLSVVGTGIRPGGHFTRELQHLVRAADAVYAVVDGLTLDRLRDLNERVESLQDCYVVGRQRDDSYAEMIDRILAPLAAGRHVCAVFYGHPGVFVWPGHEAIRRAREQGFRARMYPGVSAADCLYADLGVDPAVHGCQSFETSDFLLHARRFDPTASLILWQPVTLGDPGRDGMRRDAGWLHLLIEVLAEDYPLDHPVTLYEAAIFPLEEPRIERLALEQLHRAGIGQRTTLYLPPVAAPRLSVERLDKLGLSESDIRLGAYQLSRR